MSPGDLASTLQTLGVEVRRTSHDEVLCRCPVHEKYKGRPSTGYTFSINSETLLYQCFTCGARGHFNWLLSELAVDTADLWNIKSKLITQGALKAQGVERRYDRAVTEDVSWDDIKAMKQVPETAAKRRNLDPDVLFKRMVRWKQGWILPIVSPHQYELLGWQIKNSDGVLNHPEGVPRGYTFFGIEYAHAPTGIIVESPLDVIRFHSAYKGPDFACVASFGAGISDRQIGLAEDRFERIVLALDNDKVGQRETTRASKRFTGRFPALWDYTKYNVKDMGDMADEQIHDQLGRFT